jgi:hypothetical protein
MHTVKCQGRGSDTADINPLPALPAADLEMNLSTELAAAGVGVGGANETKELLLLSSDPKQAEEISQRLEFYVVQDRNHLRSLVYYDAAIFVTISAVIGALLAYDQLSATPVLTEGWQIRELIFWAKVVYSFSAFPFIFFTIPVRLYTHATVTAPSITGLTVPQVLNKLLTHANPTGYNAHGVCVPVLSPKKARDGPASAE